ncbi:hypothetical protein HDU81_007300 [Chytriomyces hyalinus]|nr:hypothetical protein HDU81_007300 [Chytriomyces hyalinus]
MATNLSSRQYSILPATFRDGNDSASVAMSIGKLKDTSTSWRIVTFDVKALENRILILLGFENGRLVLLELQDNQFKRALLVSNSLNVVVRAIISISPAVLTVQHHNGDGNANEISLFSWTSEMNGSTMLLNTTSSDILHIAVQERDKHWCGATIVLTRTGQLFSVRHDRNNLQLKLEFLIPGAFMSDECNSMKVQSSLASPTKTPFSYIKVEGGVKSPRVDQNIFHHSLCQYITDLGHIMSVAGPRSHTASHSLIQHSSNDHAASQLVDSKSKFPRNSPATIRTQDSDATLDVEPDSNDGFSSKETPKKVNFWGWVDVGFSYSAEEYDRKPASVEPLTKDGAMEVIEMRSAMKRITDVMYKWRYDYENNISGSPFRSEVHGQRVSQLRLSAGEDGHKFLQIQKPEFVVEPHKHSLSARFQQLSVQNRSNASQVTSKDSVQVEPRKTMKMQPNPASVPMDRYPTKNGVNSADATLNRGVGARLFKKGFSYRQPARRWAWEGQAASTKDSPVAVSGKSCQVGRGKR